jgi:hypothetical protein
MRRLLFDLSWLRFTAVVDTSRLDNGWQRRWLLVILSLVISTCAARINFRQDRQRTYNVTFEARSRNHCCHGKSVSVTYPECGCSFCYPAYKVRAPYYIVILGLPGCTVFSHSISHKRHYFRKIFIGHIVCFFLFSRYILSETFLILRRIQRDIIVNVRTS